MMRGLLVLSVVTLGLAGAGAAAAPGRRRPRSRRPLTAAQMTQAGGRRDDRRHVRHRSAARPRAQSRRLLHQARLRERLRRNDLPSDGARTASSRAAIRCRRIPPRRRSTARAGSACCRPSRAASRSRAAPSRPRCVPGEPDSGGAQFFVCVTDQPALAGQFTVFGRVSDGLDVVQKISETPADDKGLRAGARRDHGVDDPRHSAARAACRSRTRPPNSSRSIARRSRRPWAR